MMTLKLKVHRDLERALRRHQVEMRQVSANKHAKFAIRHAGREATLSIAITPKSREEAVDNNVKQALKLLGLRAGATYRSRG